jgi:hypothetical protein
MTTEAVTLRYVVVSLLPVLFIAMVGSGFLMWLRYRFNRIEKRIKQLKKEIGEEKGK